jgi:hypothetical protein
MQIVHMRLDNIPFHNCIPYAFHHNTRQCFELLLSFGVVHPNESCSDPHQLNEMLLSGPPYCALVPDHSAPTIALLTAVIGWQRPR